MRICNLGGLVSMMLSFSVLATEPSTHHSPYVGQESRSIKSLSADDVRQLQQGQGWGLAKAAELNGLPGPVHILEMKDEIALSPTQEQAVRALFETMRSQAIPLGQQLIALEQSLDRAFAEGSITPTQLDQSLDEIAKVYKALRYVHLAAHLETPKILTPQQIAQYNRLRGYDSGEPCAAVPSGHDPEMWKRHHGCS